MFLKLFKWQSDSKETQLWALLASGFFCLLTANAETINYIISRSDSFSTLLFVIALVLFMYLKKYRFIYLIPLILGMFTKEPVIVFPVIAFIYYAFFETELSVGEMFKSISGDGLKSIKKGFYVILPSLLTCALLYVIYKKMTPTQWTGGGGDWKLYLVTQPSVMVHYILNFFLPFNLTIDTDWELVKRFSDERVLLGGLLVLGLFGLAIYLSAKKETRLISFGLFWFFITLLPTSSIFPLAEVLNDHRPFFPYIGLTLALFAAVRLWIGSLAQLFVGLNLKNILMTLFFLLFFIGNAVGVHHRNVIWGNSELLWKDVTEKAPRNGRGLMNYGNALMARGDYPGAEMYFNKALEIWPNYSYLYVNKGILKGATGKFEEAESYFNRAIALNPNNPESYFYYSKYLKGRGKIAEAIAMVNKGLTISPDHINCKKLAIELKQIADKGRGNGSNVAPNYSDCMNQSLIAYTTGDYKQCIEKAEQALQFNPSSAAAYNNICAAYNGLKDFNKAIAAGEKGLKLQPNYELLQNNLAIAKKSIQKTKS